MSTHDILVVPDPPSKTPSRATALFRKWVTVPVSGPRSARVAGVLSRLTGRNGPPLAGLKANGKPDERYTRVVVNQLFRHGNPFSAASSREQTPVQTPRGATEEPMEIIEQQQVVHEEIFAEPVPEPEPEPEPAPRHKAKRGSRPVESAH